MDVEQKRKVAALLAQEQVLIFVTLGEEWPTATLQAFAETEDLDLILIMLESSAKFQNLRERFLVTVHVDTRDTGDVRKFQVIRATIQGLAYEIPRDSPEWDRLKAVFLRKNPFEEPFFQYRALRMVCVTPKRISYADGLGESFTVEM